MKSMDLHGLGAVLAPKPPPGDDDDDDGRGLVEDFSRLEAAHLGTPGALLALLLVLAPANKRPSPLDEQEDGSVRALVLPVRSVTVAVAARTDREEMLALKWSTASIAQNALHLASPQLASPSFALRPSSPADQLYLLRYSPVWDTESMHGLGVILPS